MARSEDIAEERPVPTADDIFTDRDVPRETLRGFFAGLLDAPSQPSRPVKVFHGAGGAGKSALCKKAVDDFSAHMSDQGGYPLAFVHVDLEEIPLIQAHSVFELFANRLRPALNEAGCGLPLFDYYCREWADCSKRDKGGGDGTEEFMGTQHTAAEVVGSFLAPFVEVASSIKGVGLVFKLAATVLNNLNARDYARRFPSLNLADFNNADFEKHAPEVLAGELLHFLSEQAARNGHPRALCVILDGFERIQSTVCADDAQRALQVLCSRIVMHRPYARCGFVFFGRNQLQWRHLYDQRDDPLDDTWDALLEQYLVGGLSEKDAHCFLDRAEAWYRARSDDPHCKTILPVVQGARTAILNAAEEFADDLSAAEALAGGPRERVFHPYSLDLALHQIGRHARHFHAGRHLGRGHKELQRRFLRSMGGAQRSAMHALALALTFDETLFRMLVRGYAIQGIPIQDFHSLVGSGNSHTLPVGKGYRFHSKMQEALLADLRDQPSGPQKAATVIGILVDFFSAQMAEAVSRQESIVMREAYTRAAGIMLTHAEAGLLDVEVFRQAFFALDEAVPKGLLTRARLGAWVRAEAVLRGRLSADDRHALKARENVACCTVLTGEVRTALERFQALLADMQRVFGLDHPETLSTRNNLAFATGETGDVRAALALFKALLPDQLRVLGARHPDTLMTRNNIAASTGETGDARAALQLFVELLPDQLEILGPDHPDLLRTRANVAQWTGEAGDVRAALTRFKELLPDQQRVLGADHPETLRTRNNIAHWIGEGGETDEALSLFKMLLSDQERVLGPDHPETLRTRNNIAHWTGEGGESAEALALFKTLKSAQARIFGARHPEILRTRANIAHWTAQVGEVGKALGLFEALLPDQLRVLGANHPETLRTRANIAGWTGDVRDAREALDLLKALLPDQRRVLGPDHPDTLTTLNNIAYFTSELDDISGALDLFVELLPAQQRILGPDHPVTRRTRDRIANFEQRLNPGAPAAS